MPHSCRVRWLPPLPPLLLPALAACPVLMLLVGSYFQQHSSGTVRSVRSTCLRPWACPQLPLSSCMPRLSIRAPPCEPHNPAGRHPAVLGLLGSGAQDGGGRRPHFRAAHHPQAICVGRGVCCSGIAHGSACRWLSRMRQRLLLACFLGTGPAVAADCMRPLQPACAAAAAPCSGAVASPPCGDEGRTRGAGGCRLEQVAGRGAHQLTMEPRAAAACAGLHARL